MISKDEADKIDARVEKDFELLHALMSKFGVDPNKKNAYIRLSIILARKLYPDGVRAVGRPRSLSIRRYTKYLKLRKRGRPITRQDFRANLLRAVEDVKAENGLVGRGSDKKALEILIDEIAADTKRSRLRMREECLASWQKDLSRARNS